MCFILPALFVQLVNLSARLADLYISQHHQNLPLLSKRTQCRRRLETKF
jgi:hypothetical protein